MIVIPALDLLGGSIVRLHRGDYAKVTRYDLDPVAHAASLAGKVPRLHVVDLDGAKSGAPSNRETIAALVRAFGEGVQVGGGVRDRAAVDALVSAGCARVVLGTAAIRDPAFVRAVAHDHPKRVILAVDARDGLVAVDGWTTTSTRTALDVASEFGDCALDSLLFTDIARDGTRSGPAVESTARLSEQSGRDVIASGGVGSIDDLVALDRAGIFAAVVGRALLDGAFAIEDALATLRSAS